MNLLQWRAWCWYEGLKWREYQGVEGTKLWLRYYREALWMRDYKRRHRDMLELAA